MQHAASSTFAHVQALATTALASTAGGIAAGSLWEAIGIGPAVLFLSLAGTALGLLFDPPGGSRTRLFALALIYTVVSAALAALLAEIQSLGMQRMAPVIGLLLAFSAQTVIPALRDAVRTRIRRTIGGDDGSGSAGGPEDGFGGTSKGD